MLDIGTGANYAGTTCAAASAVLDLGAARSTMLRKLEVVTGAKIILPGGAKSLTVGSQDAALSGDSLRVGGAAFSVTHRAGHVELTAVKAATETASPTASSTDRAVGQMADSASAGSTADTAAAGAGGAVRKALAAVGAALAAAAGAVLLALRIRRRRGNIGRRRHGR